jgi:hypothetical protein
MTYKRIGKCPECGGSKPSLMACVDCGYSHISRNIYKSLNSNHQAVKGNSVKAVNGITSTDVGEVDERIKQKESKKDPLERKKAKKSKHKKLPRDPHHGSIMTGLIGVTTSRNWKHTK